MAEKSVEDRLKSLENDRDEWKSCCRVKTELVDLLHPALNSIVDSFPVENRTRIRAEIQDVFGNPDALLGVFPVGAPWTQEKALDIRFRLSLLSLRANHLVKFVLGPISSVRKKATLSCGFLSPLLKWRGSRSAVDATETGGLEVPEGAAEPSDAGGAVATDHRYTDILYISFVSFL